MLQALKINLRAYTESLLINHFSFRTQKSLACNLRSQERGSMILVLTFGVALLAGSMAVATAYMSTTNATIKKVNEDLDLENLQNLISTYFSNEDVCNAHFEGQSLLNDASTDEIFFVTPAGAKSNRPMSLINDKVGNFSIARATNAQSNSIISRNLDFMYKNGSKVRPSHIKLQVELDGNARIQRCRAHINTGLAAENCNQSMRGKIILDEQNIPRACNGNNWVPATHSGGFFRFYTDRDGNDQKCPSDWANPYTGGCSCPPGFTPRMIVEFESNCQWKYYQENSNSGCGTKTMECIHGVLP